MLIVNVSTINAKRWCANVSIFYTFFLKKDKYPKNLAEDDLRSEASKNLDELNFLALGEIKQTLVDKVF